MRMASNWRGELLRLAGTMLLAVLVGMIFGQTAAWLLVALALVLFWHLRQLYRLQCWLTGDRRHPPESSGIWGHVVAGLMADRRRDEENRERMSSVISRFRKVNQALPDGVVVLGKNNEIEAINRAATQLLGIRFPQDRGQNIGNFLRDPEISRFLARQQDDKTLTIRSPINLHLRVSIRQVLIDEVDFQRKLIIARDVTRLYQLQRVRQDFIANVSHELRTPLTVVAGYVELLQSQVPATDLAVHKPLDRMHQQTRRLTGIVDDLLNLSTLESSKPPGFSTTIDVPSLIARCLSHAEDLSQDQHRFSAQIDEQLGMRGNAHELESVLSNLLSNAVRYTPPQGKISVSWEQRTDGPMLVVQDTGIGIPPEHISRLPQRFYRVDSGRSRETGGTGLGLAIVKHVLDRHGARMQIDSRIDQGSTFTCHFPNDLAAPLEVSRMNESSQKKPLAISG